MGNHYSTIPLTTALMNVFTGEPIIAPVREEIEQNTTASKKVRVLAAKENVGTTQAFQIRIEIHALSAEVPMIRPIVNQMRRAKAVPAMIQVTPSCLLIPAKSPITAPARAEARAERAIHVSIINASYRWGI